MSTSSSQHRVRQRIEEGIVASRARIGNWPVIPERNVVRADVLVAPLDQEGLVFICHYQEVAIFPVQAYSQYYVRGPR
jgi:hypothetical protein